MIIANTVDAQMYEQILEMILAHRLSPGEKIDPKAIAAASNTSVMPVRNALRALTAEGLVETRQRVGIYVRRYSEREVRQIASVRRLYEMHCLELYGGSIDREEAGRLSDLIEDTDAYAPEMMKLDERIHYMIVAASGNEFLISQYAHMFNLFRVQMYDNTVLAEQSKKDHLAILRAILEERGADALELLSDHLNRSIEFFGEGRKAREATGR